MGEYLGLFYMALGIIWMGKGVLNLMGKGIPEDVKKKLSEERLQIFIRKTGVSCLWWGLAWFVWVLFRCPSPRSW